MELLHIKTRPLTIQPTSCFFGNRILLKLQKLTNLSFNSHFVTLIHNIFLHLFFKINDNQFHKSPVLIQNYISSKISYTTFK